MSELIDNNIRTKKTELLEYFRSRSREFLSQIKQTYGEKDYKLRASAINSELVSCKENLIKTLKQKAQSENWSSKAILEGVLLITYTNYIVMMESRNEVWPYEYMTFARRIGELWEPFCQLCWENPINQNVKYIIPPLFNDVRIKLSAELNDFIDSLNITEEEKAELRKYYQKVWTLVTSGEISLELDLHFENGQDKFVVDFKSGFSSNEKGNTNRLLLVASIYKILEEGHQCLLFVRASEENNNHYLQTLKRSGLWTVYCGTETYKKIEEVTGFNLANWMNTFIDWEKDFDSVMYSHLKKNSLLQYLEW